MSAAEPHGPASVIGLGAMGHALAVSLLARGHELTVWNRTPARADDLVRNGARRAASAAEAIAASPVTLVCISDYASAEELLRQARTTDAALSGAIIVHVATGTDEDASRLADLVTAAGGQYLDGAIQAYPRSIGTPNAAVYYSGPETTFRAAEATLAGLGAPPNYLGAQVGAANVLDNALLTLHTACVAGFSLAAALTSRAGISLATFLPAADATTVATRETFTHMGKLLGTNDLIGRESTVEVHLAALEACHSTIVRHGVDDGVVTALLDLLRAARAAGHGGDDIACLARHLARP